METDEEFFARASESTAPLPTSVFMQAMAMLADMRAEDAAAREALAQRIAALEAREATR